MIRLEIRAGNPEVVIYSSLTPDDLLEARLHEEINRAWSLRLRLPYNHAALARLTQHEAVRVYFLRTSVSYTIARYLGRVVSVKRDTMRTATVDVEGRLACLNDTVIPPFHFPEDVASDPAYQTAAATGNVVDYFLRWIIGQHNAQVGTSQQITVGTVTVTDPNNYIARSSDSYMTTAEVIKTRLLDSALGGYYVSGRLDDTIEYYASAPVSSGRTISLGRDILSIDISEDSTEAFSDIVPIGSEGLTISGQPDGAIDTDLTKAGDRIYSAARRALYGRVARVVEWPDVTQASRLQTKAAALLAAEAVPQEVSISAIDSAWVSADDNTVSPALWTPLRIGYAYPVTSEPHGLQAQPMLLSSITRDLLQPGRSTVTLGRLPRTQTAAVANLTIKEG